MMTAPQRKQEPRSLVATLSMITILRERRRWLVAGLLFFISTIAFLDRQTLSVLEKTLEKILGFSATEYSYIVTGFLIATGLGYLFAGAMIDRYGVRPTFAVALTVWSVAAVAHSLATGWISLLVLRVVLGLGESFYTPAAARVLRDWIPQRERGVCWAVFSTGNFMGAMIAPPLVAWLALHYHWPLSFVVTGASGFVLLGAWLWFYQSPERHPWLSAAERTVIMEGRGSNAVAQEKVPLLRLFCQPVVRSFFFTRFLTDPFTFFFLFWLPAYLQSSHGFSLAKIGLMAWIPFLGSDLGALTGGAVSDWLVRRGADPRLARRRILLVVACLTPLTLVAVRVGSAPLAVGLITLVMFLQASWNTNLTTLIIESTPPPYVARVVALTLMGGTVGGGLSTLLTGHVIKILGYVPVFTALGFTHLTAYAIMSIGLRGADAQPRQGGRQEGLP
jgi:MFS transporter, ACS family, hexuronate transporter